MIKLDHLYNADRFAEIARLHTNAFNWRPQNRIPLGIHVVNPEHARGLDYADWLKPESFFPCQAKTLVDTLTVGSDLLPTVAINHLGDALLTSMFGAEQFMPESVGATLQDVGPTPLPVFPSADHLADLRKPSLREGIIPEIEDFMAFYRKSLPPWVHVVAPGCGGPFSTAMELRGSDLILDCVDHADLARGLIDMCADLLAEVEAHLRRLVGTPLDTHVTSFSILGPGVRIGEDSFVNLSPDLIRLLCLPAFARVSAQLPGDGHVHFCSLAHSRFEHVYGVLAEAANVKVVSSQFAFEYYKDHLDEIRGRLACESFYGDAYAYVSEKFGSFRDWAFDFVPRFKNESGLVLYFQVGSVEEGRDDWDAWQQAHTR